MIKKYLFIILILFGSKSFCQELNCTVEIDFRPSKQISNQAANPTQALSEIKNIIVDFMNNRRWSKDEFTQTERINCGLNIIITQATAQGEYNGKATLTMSRPIYGTSFESPMFRFVDQNFSFNYNQNTPVDYNENVYNSNLVQILAFYANLILAIDYDSYSKMGGTPYVQKLFNIVNIVPSNSGFKGWRSIGEDTNNRYWLAENLMNQQMVPVREGLYNYHRLGLDNFAADTFGARKKIINLITKMNEINLQKPSSILFYCFFDSKHDEIVNIFSQSPAAEKQKIYIILINLDPTHTENYRKLLI